MMFGGIFAKWFGGGQRKRVARFKLIAEEAQRQADLSLLNKNQGTTPGYLAYDRNDDGAIDLKSETLFTNDFEGAASDVEGLVGFDDNQDGVLDPSDSVWYKFGVWTDANKNGKFDDDEFKSLDDMNIASIDLKQGQADGLLHVTYTDGKAGTLALSLFAQQQ